MALESIDRRGFLTAASLLSVGSVGMQAAQAADESATPPNIVWLIADDVSPQEFGCYGHPTIRTPHIDRLARGGVRFSRAYVTTSSCSPSRASLFTGKYPHSTGAENLHDPLPRDQAVLPELLAQRGYYSGSVGKFHMGSATSKKFDRVMKRVEDWRPFLAERPADRPFFLSVGFHDAHRPFERGCVDPPHAPEDVTVPPYLPDTPEVRGDLAAFYDEISRMDEVIGALTGALEREGILENTLIVFLGDNGMPFPRAKTTLYESGIQTPLVVHWPAALEGRRVDSGLTSLVDLAPTMLEAGGVPVPDEMQGQSVLQQLRQPGGAGRQYVFAEKNWHDMDDHSRAVTDGRYKYIRNAYPERPLSTAADCINSPTFKTMKAMRDAGTLTDEAMLLFRSRRAAEELYDLEYDAMEFHSLAADPAYGSALERMRGALDRWVEETHDVSPSESLPDEFDSETGKRIHPPHQRK